MTCQLCKRELAPDETVWRCSGGGYWRLPQVASLCEECRNKVLGWTSSAYTAKYGYGYGHGHQRQQVFKNERYSPAPGLKAKFMTARSRPGGNPFLLRPSKGRCLFSY